MKRKRRNYKFEEKIKKSLEEKKDEYIPFCYFRCLFMR
jgi:hypothetical protein